MQWPADVATDRLTARSSSFGGGPISTEVAPGASSVAGGPPVAEATAADGWRLIGRQMRIQRWGIAAGVGAGLVWTAAKVSVPKLVQLAIDRGIQPKDRHQITHYALLIAGAGLVVASFTGVRRYSAFREARRTEAVLRDRLFAHLQRLHFAYHDGQQTGQLMSRANNDLQQIQNAVVIVPIAIANLATVAAVVVLLVTIDPLLTLLALGSLP
ncbi:MAG: ABC transporter transmembrane domain-containing protein, partial [Acidimicrobiales bacterium]